MTSFSGFGFGTSMPSLTAWRAPTLSAHAARFGYPSRDSAAHGAMATHEKVAISVRQTALCLTHCAHVPQGVPHMHQVSGCSQ